MRYINRCLLCFALLHFRLLPLPFLSSSIVGIDMLLFCSDCDHCLRCLVWSCHVIILKASNSEAETADTVLLLYGPRYDHQLLTCMEEVDRASAEVKHLTNMT